MRTAGILFSLLAVACEAGSGPETRTSVVATVHQSRCGSCHSRVEPGQRAREELDTALLRHRKRVRLDETEWKNMVDYLAAPTPRTKS